MCSILTKGSCGPFCKDATYIAVIFQFYQGAANLHDCLHVSICESVVMSYLQYNRLER